MAAETVEKIAREVSSNRANLNDGYDNHMEIADIAKLFLSRWKLLVLGLLCAALLAVDITYLIPPTYTASTPVVPPQQAQGAAASALVSLGSLSGLAGAAAGIRNTGADIASCITEQCEKRY